MTRSNSNISVQSSAPGRLDVMGGIADYSGSLVLQMPIHQQTTVTITLRNDYQCILSSTVTTGEVTQAALNFRDLLMNGKADYSFANRYFHNHKDSIWAAYIVGCALVLQKEKGIDFKGADFIIVSDVPLGKGVSSSASLEVATMKALAKAFDLSFQGTELARLAQRVENYIVGAPCGLMDQLATSFGSPRSLLPIVCQPDKIAEPIPVPSDVFLMGIDSGVRHSVGGSSYSDVRCAAFMGYSIIAKSLGSSVEDLEKAKGQHALSDLPYGGYLCNITVKEFEDKFLYLLPEQLSGKEFLSRYGTTIDGVTAVQHDTDYAIRNCTAHPVYENDRVCHFRDLISGFDKYTKDQKEKAIEKMGALMYAAHESYSSCGLGSQRTDEIVTRAKKYKGIYGAKITGGGSGGTVCLLAMGKEGKQSVINLHRYLSDYYQETLVLFDAG